MTKVYRYDDPQLGCNALVVPDGKELPAEYVGKAVLTDLQLDETVFAPFTPPDPRDYTDGVTAIWANGHTQRGRCRSDKVMTAEQARVALAQGAPCVFVMTGDVEAVRGDGTDR
jgi:hypothetical protein